MAGSGDADWRVFIGSWDDGEPEWQHLNELCGYSEGRLKLADSLQGFLHDECSDCRDRGLTEGVRLAKMPLSSEFAGSVDGEDYLLIRADRTNLDDLRVTR